MNILETMRRMQIGLGGDSPTVVRLEVGDYEGGTLETLSPTQSRLVVIKDGAFLSWTLEQEEWNRPAPLIMTILEQAPVMLLEESRNRERAGK
jgi:hypothetical protein